MKIEIFKRKFKRDNSDFWIKMEGAPEFDSIEQMFKEIRPYLQRLSDSDRTNLYFTQGLTSRDESKKHLSKPKYNNSRAYLKQNMLLIDIDHIIKDREKELIDFVIETLGLKRERTPVVATGYGIQFSILFEQYFVADKNRTTKYFVKKCEWLESKLRESGFIGEKTNVDRSVADPNKLARLGDTINHKPGREDREAVFVNDTIAPQFDSVETFLNIPSQEKPDNNEPQKKDEYEELVVDSKTVEQECGFLKEMLKIPAKIHEPEVRAAASILKFLDNGVNRAEQYFKDIRQKGDSETVSRLSDKGIVEKIAGLKFHSCTAIKNIDTHNFCKGCPHFGKVTGPLNIQSKEFKLEKAHAAGFRKKVSRRWIVDNQALLAFFEEKFGYFISDENQPRKVLYKWDGIVFKPLLPSAIQKFCYDFVKPEPNETERNEFLNVVALHNMKNLNELFHKNTEGKINFKNGVLHIETGELKAHSHDAGFTYYLHCNYDKNAVAHRFIGVVNEWLPSQDSRDTLQMYCGDILVGGKPKAHKVMIMTGNGRNGKSAAAEIVDAMLGGEESDSASIAMNAEDFSKSHMMAELQTKALVIIDEQRPNLPAGFWENLKRLSAGGKVTADKKFKDSQTFNNRARFMIIVNQLSSGTAHTQGFLSRLLIVNFPRFFKPEERNPFLVEELVRDEAAGIANWFIDGFKRLKALNFQFPENKDLQDALDEYQEETNMLYAFCKHYHVELGDPKEQGFATGNLGLHKVEGKVSGVWADTLYNEYVKFVKAQYHEDSWSAKRVESRQIFARKLNQKFNKKLGIKNTKANRAVITGLRVRGFDVDCDE